MTALKKAKKSFIKKLSYLLFAGFILFFAGSINVQASSGKADNPSDLQQSIRTVKGTVMDNTGNPLIGVTVAVKGTTTGTMTDIDGAFSINVQENQTLTFTYVGYKPVSVVANKLNINITMEEDSKIMDEVVIVGYGAQKKENLTGAVSSVDVEKALGSRPIADVGRGLQGVVPGLTIVIPSGEVGSDPIMKIRGQFSSIEGGKTPLILVDNVEIPSIQMINPDDIESISVLKDAASTSIYGSKGAFGVILITTKKGAKTESMNVSYSTNFSWQNVSKKMEMGGIDALDYALTAAERVSTNMVGVFWKVDRTSYEKSKEWQEKYGGSVGPTDPIVYNRDWYMQGANKMGVRIYDPYESMVREWAPSQSHNLSLNGRSGKTAYNIGLGYVKQNGMMKPAKHDDFKRYNASISITSDINKFLSIRGGAMYSDRDKRYAASGASQSDPWYYMYRWGPTSPIGVEEHGQPLRGPVYETANTVTSNYQYIYYSINLGATVNITKDWDFKFDYTHYNQQNNTNFALPMFTALDVWGSIAPPVLWTDDSGNQVFVDDDGNIVSSGGVPAYRFAEITYNPPGGAGNIPSQISQTKRQIKSNTINAYSTYNLKLGDEKEHVFKFMAGMNRVTYDWTETTAYKSDLNKPENPQFNFATGTENAKGNANWNAELGYFGRINYAYKDRYLLEANLRRDGSSKFPKHLRWRTYPSFSGGWIITNESFIPSLDPILTFAKFRASWGSLGDHTVPNSLYVPTLAYSQSLWLDSTGKQFQSYRTPAAVSGDITWQDLETLDLGIDLRFWKDKVGFTFDWYQTYTKNMIIPGDALPYTYGAAAPKGNFGEARTRGWEITVDFNHRFSNGLGINAMATLADATTFITKGADYKTPWEDRSIGTTYSTGRRYGDIFGYVTDRLYQKDDFVYDDAGNIKTTTIIVKGVQKTTNMLAGENPNYQAELEAGRFYFGPGDVKYADLDGDGMIGPGRGTNGDMGDRKVIGNTTPRYEYGFRLGADYKGVDFSIFFQGIGKRDVWGGGPLAIAGFNTGDGAIPQAFAGDFWKEDRTDAFYPRPWNMGGSNTGFNMQQQTRYLLDMSYLRIKNITLGYSVSPKLLKKIYLTKARVYVSLENFFTFDNLHDLPIDPEEIAGYSMFNTSNYNSGRTGTGTPTFKSASVGVQLSF